MSGDAQPAGLHVFFPFQLNLRLRGETVRRTAGGFQNLREEQSLAEQIRDQAASEDRMWLGEERRAWFGRNDPSTLKGTLLEQVTGKPAEKPPKYTQTPGVKSRLI
jgi:hypothetical protein